MKNFLKKHTKLVIWAIFMVIFNALALLIPHNKLGDATVAFWGGFAFINVAFVGIGVVLFALQLDKTTIFSNTVMVYVFSAIYFIITFILNLIYMIVFDAKNFYLEVFLPNGIIIALYIAAMLVANAAMRHMSAVTKHTETKVAARRLTTAKVEFIMNNAENEVVKKALFDLKEDVQYSDPIGNESTVSLEQDFENQLNLIEQLIAGEAAEEAILKAIKLAKNKLQFRNETLKANK